MGGRRRHKPADAVRRRSPRAAGGRRRHDPLIALMQELGRSPAMRSER
jgi:hypothetical protein